MYRGAKSWKAIAERFSFRAAPDDHGRRFPSSERVEAVQTHRHQHRAPVGIRQSQQPERIAVLNPDWLFALKSRQDTREIGLQGLGLFTFVHHMSELGLKIGRLVLRCEVPHHCQCRAAQC